MPKASEVAAKLKAFAALIEQLGEENVSMPFILLRAEDAASFKYMSKAMPRPLKKSIDYEGTTYSDLVLTHTDDIVHISLRVPQSKTCRLVSPAIPAKYECDPILSHEDENEFIEV